MIVSVSFQICKNIKQLKKQPQSAWFVVTEGVNDCHHWNMNPSSQSQPCWLQLLSTEECIFYSLWQPALQTVFKIWKLSCFISGSCIIDSNKNTTDQIWPYFHLWNTRVSEDRLWSFSRKHFIFFLMVINQKRYVLVQYRYLSIEK